MKKANYLFFLMLIFIACKRDCTEATKNPETIGLSDEKAILTYNGNEKLLFLKNNIDTITFIGQGIKTEYQYTTTQEDCPEKIPLENKYIVFVDTLQNNNFLLQLYISSQHYNNCIIKINNIIITNGLSNNIIDAPRKTINILGVDYNYVVNIQNGNNEFWFQVAQKGLVKFKIDNDLFEIIH